MIIGIDIGTTYSSVAYLKGREGKAIKPVSSGNTSIPSAVYADKDGELLIGEAAYNSRNIDPSRYKDNFKRDFGSDKPYILGGRNVTLQEIYTKYFSDFKKSAESFTGQGITKAYITHPAAYSKEKKTFLEEAANYAGLLDIELIDEPTAAALSYFADHMPKEGETLLVYDLGGGTLDLTLIQMTKTGFRLLTEPVGNQELGGADFDRLVLDDMIAQLAKENDLSKALADMRWTLDRAMEAKKIKEALSNAQRHETKINFGFDYLSYSITREYFNSLIMARVDAGCGLIEKIARNADLTPAQIDRTLCVGGSTRIPFVTIRIEETIGKQALKTADPELAVCMGAVLKEFVDIIPASTLELYEKGISCENIGNYVEASKWYHKAAEQEHGMAQLRLGDMYNDGIGVEENDEEAVKWYRKAANQGIAMAQNMLGRVHQEGCGVKQSDIEAVKWYQKAAEQGLAFAQNNLGFMHQSGLGVPKNYTEAVKWYRKAAEQGEATAQYSLGFMYQEGCGVKQNDAEAVKWYQKAAKQGEEEAQKALYGMGIDSGNGTSSVWKKITSESDVEEYMLLLLMRLKLKNFLGTRHFLSILQWKESFKNKLAGALTYAKLSNNEYPIYIYDYTILGKSAQNGILATTNAIYFCMAYPPATKCLWSHISNFDQDTIKTKGGESYTIPTPNSANDRANMLVLLHQIWNDLR